MLRKMLAFSSLLALAVLVGCGGSLKPVEGVVTLDGKPLEGAMVQFNNADNPGAPSAEGTTDSGGKFTLSSRGKKGVPPGTYKATVTKTESKAGAGASSVAPGSPEYLKMMKGASAGPAKSLVPDKYTKVGTTPFSIKVPDSAPIKLDLTSK